MLIQQWLYFGLIAVKKKTQIGIALARQRRTLDHDMRRAVPAHRIECDNGAGCHDGKPETAVRRQTST